MPTPRPGSAPSTPTTSPSASKNARRYREYNDLLVLSTARRLGCPLLTFDKRLSARAGEFDVGLVLQAQAHNAGSSSKSHPAGA